MRKPITDKRSIKKAEQVKEVIGEYRDYLPLTVRQILYRMEGKGYCSKKYYSNLIKLISRMRVHGWIPWDTIDDRVRYLTEKEGFEGGPKYFIECHRDWILSGYKKDLLENQSTYIEIWCEKDALTGVLSRVADKYSIQVGSKCPG